MSKIAALAVDAWWGDFTQPQAMDKQRADGAGTAVSRSAGKLAPIVAGSRNDAAQQHGSGDRSLTKDSKPIRRMKPSASDVSTVNAVESQLGDVNVVSRRATLPTLPTPLRRLPKSHSPEQPPSLDESFIRTRHLVVQLWDDLDISQQERDFFIENIFHTVSYENAVVLNDELERLVGSKSAAKDVEDCIQQREEQLYSLQDMCERLSRDRGFATPRSRSAVSRELPRLIAAMREATLRVIESIVRWREIRQPTDFSKGFSLPYMWRGVPYLQKVNNDLKFLETSAVAPLIEFGLKNNPLLDPRVFDVTANKPVLPVAAKRSSVRNLQANLRDLPRDRLDFAAKMLQRAQKRSQATSSEEQQLFIQEMSATRIQANWRGHRSRMHAQQTRRRWRMLLVSQTAGRSLLARRRRNELRKVFAMAQRIQAWYRGFRTRRELRIEREQNAAAVIIQRNFKKYSTRRKEWLADQVWFSASTVQRLFRGHRARRIAREQIAAKREAAALRLQTQMRGHLARKRVVGLRLHAVARIQAWFRGRMQRGTYAHQVNIHNAAISIQCCYRRFAAQALTDRMREENHRREMERQFHQLVSMVIRIQCLWRMYRAKKHVAAIKKERRRERRRLRKQQQQETPTTDNAMTVV